MKHHNKILLTAFTVTMLFLAVIYSSCYRDPCRNVYCQNGGVCSRGTCLCPSGYTGSYCQYASTTSITYYNNTFTPVYITINGTPATIPSGGSVIYDGAPGDYATGTAYTSGQNYSGNPIGETIYWDFNDYFPQSGMQTVDINVSSSYFFLLLRNMSGYNIEQEYVNYRLSAQTYDNVYIPNDGVTYDMGYYKAYTNTNLYLLNASGSHYWSNNIYLSFSQNQSYTYTAY